MINKTASMNLVVKQGSISRTQRMLNHLKKDRQLIIIFLPCLLFYIIFRYGPIYGLITAFIKYDVYSGILHSPWVGLKYFEQFFSNPDAFKLIRNTFLLGFYDLLWTFPITIIFAILLNEIKKSTFKKTIQTISYLPSFLSVVIVSSMIIDFLSPNHGIVNNIIAALGFQRNYFMIEPQWFRTIYIFSDIWVGTGVGAIIYLASIASIDPSLYESGIIDGCNRFQSIRFITIPCIFPTIATMFILNSGNIFTVGYEKVLLLYNPTTYEVADVIQTYVYRKGILEQNISYASAVGLFQALISLMLLLAANAISKKFSEQSLW
jgi:putative aldouronate transport system permease protein